MMKEIKNKILADVWAFIVCALFLSFFINWFKEYRFVHTWVLLAPFGVGLLAFFFQLFVAEKPPILLYSKGYPYRKLKPYGVISAFLFFEYILVWGLHTKQIILQSEDLFLISAIFIGVIAYYHAFVRMKISLRFMFLAIFIPILSIGAALGLGSYFKILSFAVPTEPIGSTAFFNTVYWILFYMFFQVVCEEPAFRGYLLQRLINKGEFKAILYSSIAFAIWRIPFSYTIGIGINEILIAMIGNLIMGVIFALLFVKGRNLLVPIICHGIIDGLLQSIFAPASNPGIRQYIEFLHPGAELHLMILWFGCLLIGLTFLTFIPRKQLHAR